MKSKIYSIITTAFLTFSTLWYSVASAADKPETLKGTVTLGSTGYGIRLENGQVIGFLGRGGNKVFATCHNGDTCEITGIIARNIKNPLFLTVVTVRKLAGPTTPNTKLEGKTATSGTPAAATNAPQDTQNQSPFLLDDNGSQAKGKAPDSSPK